MQSEQDASELLEILCPDLALKLVPVGVEGLNGVVVAVPEEVMPLVSSAHSPALIERLMLSDEIFDASLDRLIGVDADAVEGGHAGRSESE